MKNWTVKEAVKVICENKDTEAIKEIVKHFPLFAVIAAGRDFDALAAAMPEHLTVRKVENELNNGAASNEDAEDQDENIEDGEEQDLSAMTKNELIALCEKKGLKVQKHQKPKQYYIDALNEAEDSDTDTDTEDEDSEDEDDPVALYKKCKKAGLKVAPKKSAKYYKDQLAKAAEAEDEDDDDWDDDEEEEAEEKPKKAAKKAPAKKAAKKKAEPEEEEDDEEEDEDDEWDI